MLFEINFIQRGSLFQIIAPLMLLLLCANAMLVPNLGWTKEDENSLGDGGCSGVEPCLLATFYFLSDHESETRHGKRPDQSSVFVRVCLWSACSGSDSYSNPGQIVLEGGFSLEFPLSLSFWCAASSQGSLASLRSSLLFASLALLL